jgi:threonyl-tRNA synthetase
LLKEWKVIQEEAKKRDHRNIGKQQELFFFDELSPGSCFFLPHGARIYNKLMEFIRGEYRKRGFTEVITPNMYSNELWKISGHADKYAENMFNLLVEKQPFALKPMNCPGHCVMFRHRQRSYRELPLRFADFGVLHRNEFSGALHGLTRVRRFQQDDAHIFCAPDHIEQEINGAIAFMNHVYGVFGFDFEMELSTRPEKYLGEPEVWDRAEKALEAALNGTGRPWKLNPGDGAFYGPKIDIHIRDALKRSFQCATIQLDFNLPVRFDLQFVHGNNELIRPVIIHRAILGSVERFMGILVEHTGGKWPLWISPRQVLVISVADRHKEFVEKTRQAFWDAGFFADSDVSGDKLDKKIRNGQLAQYNYLMVVGDKEVESGSVNIRTRDNKVHGTKSIAEAIAELRDLADKYQ